MYLLNEYSPCCQSTFYVGQQDPEGLSENTWQSNSTILLNSPKGIMPQRLILGELSTRLLEIYKNTISNSSKVYEERASSQRNFSGK